MYKILVADDEMKIRETIKDYFTAKGAEVVTAKDGQDVLDKFEYETFDLVVLDIMMPVLSGFDACKAIRKSSNVPILFLTAMGQEQDFLKGYNLGCDDYIVKPFPLSVLFEKCVSMINRYKGISNNLLSLNGITLDLNAVKVCVDGREITLQNKDFRLLKFLMENKNRVLDRDTILIHIWGYDFDGDDRVVDTHIKRIRKALREKSSCIKTVINVGYCFEEV